MPRNQYSTHLPGDARASILPRLECVRPAGEDRWTARCPAHEDSDPSLSIRQASDKVLLRCFAGCALADITAAIGLEIGDLFAEKSSSPRPAVSQAEVSKARHAISIARADRRRGLRPTPADLATLVAAYDTLKKADAQ